MLYEPVSALMLRGVALIIWMNSAIIANIPELFGCIYTSSLNSKLSLGVGGGALLLFVLE